MLVEKIQTHTEQKNIFNYIQLYIVVVLVLVLLVATNININFHGTLVLCVCFDTSPILCRYLNPRQRFGFYHIKKTYQIIQSRLTSENTQLSPSQFPILPTIISDCILPGNPNTWQHPLRGPNNWSAQGLSSAAFFCTLFNF